jgi:hypothetical protein
MNKNQRMSRRDFLKLGSASIGSLTLKEIMDNQNQGGETGVSNTIEEPGRLQPLKNNDSPGTRRLPEQPLMKVGEGLEANENYEKTAGITYYVRKDGNDTTGDGSVGAPWLTLSKAMAVAGSGDVVLVGDGLYEENTSGLGYWNINKALVDYLTIEAEAGETGNVRIQGSSHAAYNTLLRCGYLRFRYIQFTQRVTTNVSAFSVLATANVSSVIFDFCSFTITADHATLSQGFIANQNDGYTASHFTFTGCTFTVLAYSEGSHDGCRIGITGTTGLVSQFTFADCTANGRYGLLVNGATDILIDGGYYRGDYGAAICIGIDAESNGKPSSATIRNVTAVILGSHGHGVLIGNGATGCVVDGLCVPVCFDYALALKEHGGPDSGTEVKNCDLRGGTHAALYCKAVSYPNIHHNRITGSKETTKGAFRMPEFPTNHKNEHVIFIDNHVIAQSGMAVEWGDVNQDNGGGICNRNVYHLRGTGSLAKVRGSVVSTMEAMIAAWSGYDVSGNDRASVMVEEGEVTPAWLL